MISLVDIGSGLWPYAHNSKDPQFGGWWNDLDMIEIGNGGRLSAEGAVMYVWAVGSNLAQAGWSIGSDGTVKHGGLCLTAGNLVELTPCSSANKATQAFKLEENGNLHL